VSRRLFCNCGIDQNDSAINAFGLCDAFVNQFTVWKVAAKPSEALVIS
jgi:hypothetical protein